MGYLVLDSATLDGKQERYAGRNASALVDVKEIEGAVQRSLLAQRLEAEGLQPSRIKSLTDVNLDMKAERLTERGREAGGLASALFSYLLAFVLYMMLVFYGQQILRGVMEEKTSRVAEVVISSVSTDTLLAGKVIGVGLASLTQMVVMGVLQRARVQGTRCDPRALRRAERADSAAAHRLRRRDPPAPLLRARLHLLRRTLRGDGIDGLERAGRAAGVDARDAAAHRIDRVRAADSARSHELLLQDHVVAPLLGARSSCRFA